MKVLIFIFFLSLGYSQWSSFHLSGLDIETKETKLLFRYAGLGSTNQPLTSINGLKRVSIGFSLNKGFSNTVLMPLINGQLKVSWNLALRGRMSNYSTKAGTVQLYGWGMKFVPGSKNMPSKWKLLFDLGNFNSFRQFKSNTIQFLAIRSTTLKRFPINIGLGANIINISQNHLSNTLIPNKLKLQSNFINIGTTLNLLSYKIKPQLWLGMDYNLFSISFVETF